MTDEGGLSVAKYQEKKWEKERKGISLIFLVLF